MKACVIYDTDMKYVVAIVKTIEGAMRRILETMEECGYESFTIEKSINDDEWEVTFPCEDEKCVGHWVISMHDVED